MAFARLLRSLTRDPGIGRRIVPIVSDEARTFGLESLISEVQIYAPDGQRYTPALIGEGLLDPRSCLAAMREAGDILLEDANLLVHLIDLLQILSGAEHGENRFAGHCTVGARRPHQREADDRRILRLQHVTLVMRVSPASAELPLFEFGGDAVFLEPFHGPVGRLAVSGRVSHAGTVHVREIEQVIHHLRVFKRLRPDAVDNGKVHVFFGDEE